MRNFRRLILAAALAGLSACAVPQEVPDRVPPSGSNTGTQSMPLPRAATAPTPSRASARAFVQMVDRVEPVAERQCRQRNPRANCDFVILVDDRPGLPANAFQTLDESGQPIIVFTLSLIADLQNPDEMAFVLAHEASHHVAGHIARSQQNAQAAAAVFGGLAGVSGASDEAIQLAAELGAAVGARRYSKEFELEADALGTQITLLAGYDPLLGSQFFFRIPDPGDRFLGTHPANAERVETIVQTAAGLGFTG
ncbi:M48 family metallopeptidase [Pseudoroseicyclus tamaricis]|uniref:M48 family metalloprotease n=1 Tax=Pseudoroseicyclus tamaricis TaxID=2705421 RepID=A0A6B2JUH9_9RHOB|nr:M48 family metallopeptidase [Pseudoroseicyclus tamaricis]NDV02187.1 M48 family metalloprotease [Pseudoroseicyclus tamaricis]